MSKPKSKPHVRAGNALTWHRASTVPNKKRVNNKLACRKKGWHE